MRRSWHWYCFSALGRSELFFELNTPSSRKEQFVSFKKNMRLEFEQNAAFPLVENEAFETAGFSPSPDLDALLKSGIKAAQSGDREHARKQLSQATALDPMSEDAWMWLASISDYPEELLAFLNRVLDINPDNARAVEWRTATKSLLAKTFVQRAIAAHGEGSADLARQCLDHALANDGEYETAWFWKATLAPSDDERLDFLARVLNINPENEEALNAVAAIKHARSRAAFEKAKRAADGGDSQVANDILDLLLQDASDPVCENSWLLKATVAESDEDKLEFLDKVLEANPENQDAANAIAAIKKSRSQAAFAEAKEAAVAGNRKKAIEVVNKFLNDVPDSVDAWLLKSHLSLSLEEKTESLEKALELDPKNAAAKSGLEFLSLTFGAASEEVEAAPELNETHEPQTSEPEAAVEFIEEGKSFEEAVEAANGLWLDAPAAVDPSEAETVALRPAEELFGPIIETVDTDRDTVESLSPFDEKVADEVLPADEEPVEAVETPFEVASPEQPAGFACPYCHAASDPQAFECTSCHATLTLSDIESLLANQNADREVIQHAVTAMEAQWNMREFCEQELTELGIGHFNLYDFESGLKYLQEASRISPNNVILSGQVNAIAIRLEEMRRQHENYDARPLGKTILVVDDSPTVRKLISGKLEKAGHAVVCAVDGVDGLAKIEEQLPDLVLLDITMPRMDGYEVCKQIRANAAAKHLPVVMISGKDGFFDKVRGRMAGTTGYITKPFGPETLMKALETYLSNEDASVE